LYSRKKWWRHFTIIVIFIILGTHKQSRGSVNRWIKNTILFLPRWPIRTYRPSHNIKLMSTRRIKNICRIRQISFGTWRRRIIQNRCSCSTDLIDHGCSSFDQKHHRLKHDKIRLMYWNISLYKKFTSDNFIRWQQAWVERLKKSG